MSVAKRSTLSRLTSITFASLLLLGVARSPSKEEPPKIAPWPEKQLQSEIETCHLTNSDYTHDVQRKVNTRVQQGTRNYCHCTFTKLTKTIEYDDFVDLKQDAKEHFKDWQRLDALLREAGKGCTKSRTLEHHLPESRRTR